MRRLIIVAGLAATILITSAAGLTVWRTYRAPDRPGGGAARPGGPAPVVSASGTTASLTWTAREVLPAVPVSGYEVTRYDADGTATPAQGGCLGRVSRLSCLETGLPDGEYRYTVRPVQGGWRGPESAASAPVRVATVALAFPANAGVYGTAAWSAGCGGAADICGTVLVRPLAELSRVQVSLRAGNSYWQPLLGGFIGRREAFVDGTVVREPSRPQPGPTAKRVVPRRPEESGPAGGVQGRDTGGSTPRPGVQRRSGQGGGAPVVAPATPGRQAPVPGGAASARSSTPSGRAASPSASPSRPAATLRPTPLSGLPVQPQPEVLRAVPWRLAFPVRNFPRDGHYTVRVLATDTAGGRRSATATFRVLPKPPGAPVLTGTPAELSNRTVATFRFRGGSGGSRDVTFRCAVDGAAAVACRTDWRSPALAPGRHVFTVTAVDRGGNTGATTRYAWTVDTVGPLALDVQTTNGINLAGRLGQGDTLTLLFSKPIVAGSVVPGWDASRPLDITVRAAPGVAGGPDTLFFYDKAGLRPLRGIGTVTLGNAGYITGTETVHIPARLTAGPGSLAIQFGAPRTARRLLTRDGPATMRWYPGDARDEAGNPVLAPPTGAVEQGPADIDF